MFRALLVHSVGGVWLVCIKLPIASRLCLRSDYEGTIALTALQILGVRILTLCQGSWFECILCSASHHGGDLSVGTFLLPWDRLGELHHTGSLIGGLSLFYPSFCPQGPPPPAPQLSLGQEHKDCDFKYTERTLWSEVNDSVLPMPL